MKTRPGAWTVTTGTLVLAIMIALGTPVRGVAQSRGAQTTSKNQTPRPAQSSQSTRSARPPQPAPAARASAKERAVEDAKPATGWTKKTGEGQPDLQGFWSTGSSVMIVEPEGRIPPLSEEGLKREAELTARQAANETTAHAKSRRVMRGLGFFSEPGKSRNASGIRNSRCQPRISRGSQTPA